MNKFSLLLLFWAFCANIIPVDGQTKRLLLFDEYADGKVVFKNRQKIFAQLNYDAANKNIMYLQNQEEMILVNNQQVDSVIIGDRRFVALYGVYLEVVSIDNGEVFIDWSIKEQYKGNRGAYGQVTQNKVETINPSYWTNNEYQNKNVEIFERENSNNYWFYLNEKPVKVKNLKDLIKNFPEKKDDISRYVKEHAIVFKNASDAIKLINYCLNT